MGFNEVSPGCALQASNMPVRSDTQRQNSGLESMQSIEQALGNVEHLGNAEQNFIMDKVCS